MRIGILGFGRAGNTHFDACIATPGCTVAAVYDPAPGARKAARERGARAYASAAALLHDEDLDAVIISAPPVDHVPLSLLGMRAGLPVLCEKPLATSAAAASHVIAAAQHQGRLLQVASKFRHVPEIIGVRDLVRSGELGHITHFEISFCSPVSMAGRWNAIKAKSGGGVIIDNGCHAFDIVDFLFGPVEAVHAAALARTQSVAVEDAASLLVRTGDGVIGNVLLSWSWGTERDVYLTVRGTHGSVEVGWQATRVKRAGQEWTAMGGAYSKADAHRRMVAAFRAAVAGEAAPWISLSDCARVTATVDACYASLRTGRWQSVLADTVTAADAPVLNTPTAASAGSQG